MYAAQQRTAELCTSPHAASIPLYCSVNVPNATPHIQGLTYRELHFRNDVDSTNATVFALDELKGALRFFNVLVRPFMVPEPQTF